MRTTLTLDDDNAIRLEQLRKERDASLKAIVNEVIRRGLDASEPSSGTTPFKITAMDLGKPFFNTPEELKALIQQMDEEDDLKKLGRS